MKRKIESLEGNVKYWMTQPRLVESLAEEYDWITKRMDLVVVDPAETFCVSRKTLEELFGNHTCKDCVTYLFCGCPLETKLKRLLEAEKVEK